MKSNDHDVHVLAGSPSVASLAQGLGAALAARGFRVLRAAGAGDPRVSRQAVDETPDFVVVLPPEGLAGLADDFTVAEVRQALLTGRHIVLVATGKKPEAVHEGTLPPGLEPLRSVVPVAYDPSRPKESIALLAHRLSSETGVAERRMMRGFKVLSAVALALVVAGFSLQAVPALVESLNRPKPKPALPPFAVHWSATLQSGAEPGLASPGDPVVLPVPDGDRLSLAFSPSADGFAYVVSRDAKGDVKVLFPSDVLAGASAVRAGAIYRAPVGGGWLEVGGAARPETIYLVAGYDPVQNLEELLERPEAELSAPARRELIDNTISGLMDGRHAPVHRARTRSFQSIDPLLPVPPAPDARAVALALGEHGSADAPAPLATQVGRINVAVELSVVRPAAGRRRP